MGRIQVAEAEPRNDAVLAFDLDRPPSTSVEALLQVECVDASALQRYSAPWRDLVGRALEPNIFLEPGFALPLLQHGGMSKRVRFVLVWEEDGPATFGRLVGLFPLQAPGGVLRLAGTAQGWVHNQICSGAPLIDAGCAARVLDTLFVWLGTRRVSSAIALRLVPKDGAFFAALRLFCKGSSRGFELVEEHARACLQGDDGGDERVASFVSAKRRKEHARVSRRLSALGLRSYSSARRPSEVEAAAEAFLTLEHAGWKGARGTSFLSDPALARFARSLTGTLASEGKCRIDAIEIDGRPVAMGIILMTGDQAYFWKTAFDEAHASLSPGVQFTLDLTQRQLADRHVQSTDSCAIADHPMIDRLWPDRLLVSDIIVGVRPGAARRFRRCVWLYRLRRGLRTRAKAAVHRLRLLLKKGRTASI